MSSLPRFDFLPPNGGVPAAPPLTLAILRTAGKRMKHLAYPLFIARRPALTSRRGPALSLVAQTGVCGGLPPRRSSPKCSRRLSPRAAGFFATSMQSSLRMRRGVRPPAALEAVESAWYTLAVDWAVIFGMAFLAGILLGYLTEGR